jgi:hypothetical protein
MANLIDITSNILSQNTICFETRNINIEQIPVPIDDAKFGILNFTAVTSGETSDELEFLFLVDCSGSMSDACSDGRSKMQHIIHTLKNMIIFFHEHPNIKINITINAFDTQIYHIISRTKITDDNLNQIIHKVERIIPRGSTNIEYALRKSSEEIAKLQSEFPNNIINHIFMTDGQATDGSTDVALLQSIVNSNITNSFIGFGIEHDASLLNAISSVGKSAYYFIDKLESAGLVYGEILHGIVYKLLTEAEIIIENGLVYNFKTNTWVDSLLIGDIVSEANKIYNIISSNPDECRVNIKGRTGDLVVLFPANLVETQDLTIQTFRQRTLQILYEANDFCNRKRDFDNAQNNPPFRFNRNDPQIQALEEEKKALKLKLANFLEEIKKYMTENNLAEDKFLKNLCDDVYICYRTFGTKFGTMFCTARQTSQGTQRQYTSSSIAVTEDLYLGNNRTIRRLNAGAPQLIRQTNAIPGFELDDDDFQLPILQHTMTDFADTPYLTPQATQIMREISAPINVNIIEDDEEEEDEFCSSTQEIN